MPTGWWGAQMANERMMMIGWATPDFHGDAGAGISFLTRLTLLREVNFDTKTMNLVSNPVRRHLALSAVCGRVHGGCQPGTVLSFADVCIFFLSTVSLISVADRC
jgi:hypothetical protein